MTLEMRSLTTTLSKVIHVGKDGILEDLHSRRCKKSARIADDVDDLVKIRIKPRIKTRNLHFNISTVSTVA